MYAFLEIKGFALVYLLLCTDDPDEAISFLEGTVKLEVKFLDSVFEMRDFVL